MAHPDRLDFTQPFTAAQARAAGISRAALRGPRYQTLFRGVYLSSAIRVHGEVLARAALLLFPPGAFISHHTAAQLHGFASDLGGPVEVTVARDGDRRQVAGTICRVRGSGDVWRRPGDVPRSMPAQTFAELAGECGLVDHVALGDHLVRRFQVTPAQFAAAVAALRGRPRGLAEEAKSRNPRSRRHPLSAL